MERVAILWGHVTEEEPKMVHERKAVRPLLIVSQRNVGEQITPLRRLLVGLADESIVPVVICPPDAESERVTSVPAQVFTYPAVDLPLMTSLGFRALASQLERLRPTVIHCLCESRAALACRLARRLDVPYVQAINALVGRYHWPAIASSHCAGIVVPAQTIAASVTKSHGRLIDRVRQINMGAFVRSEPACFSQADRLPSILVAQPARSVSGYASLFGVIKALFGEGYEFMTVVIGGGRIERRLRAMLADLGLGQVVMVIPPLDPWRSVLAAADIYVQPQARTAFSVCLLEAMSVGTAVAACKGGVDDLIVHEETALVFNPDDEQSVKQTLIRFLDDYDFARRLARQAQSYLRKHYSATGMVSATLELYAQAQRQYNHRPATSSRAGVSVLMVHL